MKILRYIADWLRVYLRQTFKADFRWRDAPELFTFVKMIVHLPLEFGNLSTKDYLYVKPGLRRIYRLGILLELLVLLACLWLAVTHLDEITIFNIYEIPGVLWAGLLLVILSLSALRHFSFLIWTFRPTKEILPPEYQLNRNK